MNDRDTYLARAAEAREQAEAAKLANVRDRCLRSAEAWNEMAARAERTQRMRETLQADKDRAAQLAAADNDESKILETSENEPAAAGKAPR